MSNNKFNVAYKIKYNRNEKSGHWVPVDLENLPKEGTMVRYAREHQVYKNNPKFIKLGEIGTFHYNYPGTPGVKTEDNLFYPWINFITNISCLDMWVEDDE